MDLLREILSEHYSIDKSSEIIANLAEYGILSIFSNLTKIIGGKEASLIESTIKNAVPFAVTSIDLKLQQIENPSKTLEIKQNTTELGIRILSTTLAKFPLQSMEIISAIDKAVLIYCEMAGADVVKVQQLIKITIFGLIAKPMLGQKEADEIQELPKTKIPCLFWTKKAPLDFLLFELKKRKWIQSKNNFSKIFDNDDEELKVFWNFTYKRYLAHLIFRLQKEKYIKTKLSRGHFCIFEKHVVNSSNEKLTKNYLKKVSSKINEGEGSSKLIIKEIDNILRGLMPTKKGTIRNMKKGLLQ